MEDFKSCRKIILLDILYCAFRMVSFTFMVTRAYFYRCYRRNICLSQKLIPVRN
ncbi:hypothetical protein FYL19_01855 [Lactobacillus salivarius]|uniref:Uncharacterized protein n=2 Tax=Ligilactobacillus salivarius TaxID=1624 RepID=A0A6A8LVH6_9LACO|nr:hypothetical protein [Ligilactobacillus salivarius]MYU74049.1 hypothetical protein [Ligilactobacillus salivarius]MYU79751.1 hypothetical protein [Ligilactobacillus salivarius]MYV06753.1 hypothetical protein [Ligilactobacillus salivarius]MYV14251.1 hypothetical protein [Ligilactobacillus salivarius]